MSVPSIPTIPTWGRRGISAPSTPPEEVIAGPPDPTLQVFTKDRAGAYAGAVATVANVTTYETFLGHSMYAVTTYPGSGTWAQINNSSTYDYWSTGAGSAYRDKMEFAVRMLPNEDEPTLADGAAGDFETEWTTFAETLRDLGYGDTGTVIIRLGWEFSGDWTGTEWTGASAQHAADFAEYWRQIVTIVRTTMDAASKPGVRFCWSPARDQSDPTPAWPGDDYVDIIGLSFYDTLNTSNPATRWAAYLAEDFGLGWHATYKPTIRHSLSEWGVDVYKTTVVGDQALPVTSLFVASSSGWPSSGGTATVEIGTPQQVTFTGIASASTTTTGSHTLPVGTINVGSAASFQTAGFCRVDGQTVAYTGKTGTTLTGCTLGSGVIAAGSAVTQGVLTGASGGTGTATDTAGCRIGGSLHDQPEFVREVFAFLRDNAYEYALYFDKDNVGTNYHQLADNATCVAPLARNRFQTMFSGQAASPSSFVALAGTHSSTDANSYNTASWTPRPNRLYIMWVHTRNNDSLDATQPTITGNGLTWVHVAANLYDQAGAAHERLDCYRAMGASPTAGVTTIAYGAGVDPSADWQDAVQWCIDGFSDVDTGGTNGSAAVVQSVANKASSGTTGTATLAAFGDSHNGTYFAVARQVNEATTPESPGLALGGQLNAVPMGLQTVWLPANDTSPSATWVTTGIWGLTALEIKARTS